VDASGRHLLFVPTPHGYELEQRDGPPPDVGESVETRHGGGYVVSKLGPSPLPGDARRCAYLQHAVGP